jgi:molybdopterin/thiamine biosynthesis adenylyltransferase
MVQLTPEELARYDRQMRIQGWGEEGQRKVKSATVVVAGAGGLGCPLSIYLTVAGVGRLIIIDKDKVELSNLNRQVLHWDKDIGRYKVDSAVEKLRQLNPTIRVKGQIVEITEANAKELIGGSDVVIDAMDNFKARFDLNRACFELNIPFVHAAIYGLEARLMTVIPGKTACLQCLLPTLPPEVKPFPVLGATPAMVACLQAMEALKLITGVGETANGTLVLIDGQFMRFRRLKVHRNPSCPVCGNIQRR